MISRKVRSAAGKAACRSESPGTVSAGLNGELAIVALYVFGRHSTERRRSLQAALSEGYGGTENVTVRAEGLNCRELFHFGTLYNHFLG